MKHFNLLLMLSCFLSCFAEAQNIREDFANLEKWEPYRFSRNKRDTNYQIVTSESGQTALRARSEASASGMVFQKQFSVYEYPYIRFRWRVDSIYEAGDGLRKSGDDYPIRIFVLFEYNPLKADLLTRTRFEAAKLVRGYYPPESSVTYVWSNKRPLNSITPSPYTDRAVAIALDSGAERLGTWQVHTANVIENYRKAFGVAPPAQARLAIMNDSDDTGESSISYLDFIELQRAAQIQVD